MLYGHSALVGYIHDGLEGTSFPAESKTKGISHYIFQGYSEAIWKPKLIAPSP